MKFENNPSASFEETLEDDTRSNNDFNEEEFESEEKKEVLIDGFYKMARMSSDWTVSTILELIRRGKINLNPKFQRRDAWSNKKKSRFIESLIVGIPVPDILLGEDVKNKGTFHVIDGKQRLLSILKFFDGKLKRNLSEEDIKGFRLSGLDILDELNGVSSKDLMENEYKLNYYDILESQPIRTVVIKNIVDQSILYEVFKRLNTGSQQLSTQELRQSIYPGDFIDYLDEITDEPNIVRTLLRKENKDNRMKDNELFLRYFAVKFFKDNYDNSIRKFLDEAADYLNKNFLEQEDEILEARKQLDKAVEFVNEKFDEEDSFKLIGLDRSSLPFNRVLFELFSYFFSYPSVRKFINDNNIDIKTEYINMLQSDEKFELSITENTHQTSNFEYRFSKFSSFIFNLTNIKVV